MIVRIKPQNIKGVGISIYTKNPKIRAANGSAPDIIIEDVPESIYFRLNVERIYGSANENVECIIRKNIANVGSGEMKLEIWPKSVKGINASEMINME